MELLGQLIDNECQLLHVQLPPSGKTIEQMEQYMALYHLMDHKSPAFARQSQHASQYVRNIERHYNYLMQGTTLTPAIMQLTLLHRQDTALTLAQVKTLADIVDTLPQTALDIQLQYPIRWDAATGVLECVNELREHQLTQYAQALRGAIDQVCRIEQTVLNHVYEPQLV